VGIVDDLIDLFPDEITGQPGTVNTSGDFTPSGDPITCRCRYEMEIRTVAVRNQVKTSRLSALVAATPGFTPDTFRYTIPSRFAPNTNITAVAVIPESDENGPCYEEVLFP